MKETRLFFCVLALAMVMAAGCNLGRLFPDLSAAELKKKIDEGGPLRIIDLRTEEEYRMGRVPGAVNVAPNQLHNLKNRLPPDKKTTIVFYCRGYG